jgi:hypothetical protein
MSDEKQKPLPITRWGKPMQIPEGTGIGISGLTSGKRYLMSGREAQKAENIIALFEKMRSPVRRCKPHSPAVGAPTS